MLIFPAIDIRDGRCVRLAQGDYARETAYHDDPVEVAREFAQAGAGWLHLVDLDGARGGAPENWALIERISREVPISVQFGGGLKSTETIEAAFRAGVDRVVLGSVLVREPGIGRWAVERYGDRVVAGIDARDGQVAVHGWTEASGISALDLLVELVETGIRRFIVTDIARDGMLNGPNLDFLRQVTAIANAHIIQSGGVGSLADLRRLREEVIEGVIVGRALYEGKFTLAEALEVAAEKQPVEPRSV
jgi:phosphoribosylformimino-5-aminoimidazole carboxamide ribotide isomerase